MQQPGERGGENEGCRGERPEKCGRWELAVLKLVVVRYHGLRDSYKQNIRSYKKKLIVSITRLELQKIELIKISS